VTRPVHRLSVAEAREEELSGRRVTPAEPVADVLELRLPGPAGEIPVRFYLPHGPPLPVLVYFFGGGWVLGSLDTADHVCRRLANATPCAVASVGYRRAPEDRFPAGFEDCYAATCWVAEHGAELGVDPSRLAVGGASSGGNLAAAVTLLAREQGGPHIVFQLLVYPPVDRRAPIPSMTAADDGRSFGPEDLAWCWSHYLASPADGENPFASPLRAAELDGLPAALVITAELDPVRGQAERYAARLAEAGVQMELTPFDGAVHGFFSQSDGPDAAEAQVLAAAALRRAFGPGRSV
jgi:acetyl esterase